MKFGLATGSATMLFFASLLTSCGGGGSGSNSGNTPTPTPSASAPTPTPTSGGSGYQTLAPNPSMSISFETGGFRGFGYNGDPATGQVVPNSGISGENPRVAFRYNSTTQAYTFVTINLTTQEDRFLLFSTPINSTNASYTDDKFRGYSGPTFGGDGILRLYRSGTANPELRLGYSGFGHLARSAPLGHLNFGDFWFSYGVATKAVDVPTTGVAVYSGVLYGFGIEPVVGQKYTIEGTSSLTLNYATRRLSGEFNMIVVAEDGSRTTVDAGDFSDVIFGNIEDTPTNFSGNMTGSSGSGNLEGMLFGPAAVEVSGVFAVQIVIPSVAEPITIHGSFAAIKT
jgi:hypothetical protein